MEYVVTKENLRYKYRDAKYAYIMIAPAIIAILLFQGVPIVMALVRSFQDYNTKAFVGFRNFLYVLKQEEYLKSFLHSLIYLAIILPVTLISAFFLALVLKNMQNATGAATKILIYLPSLFSGILTSIMFLLIFNYGGGLISYFFVTNGQEAPSFNTMMPWPYIIIILMSLWGGLGANTLVLYAGAISIPKDYYEAAMLDGATAWTRMIHITIPCMKNYFLLQIIGITCGTLQMFELPLMIGGGVDTWTPVLYIYNLFIDFTVDYNITTAGAIIVAILIGVINAFTFKILKSEKSLDD